MCHRNISEVICLKNTTVSKSRAFAFDPLGFWVNRYAGRKAYRDTSGLSDDPLLDPLYKRRKKLRNKGMSLVEIIIVIAIIAILAAAIAPALLRYIDKSRKAVDVANAEVIYKAAEMAATLGSDDACAGWSWAATYTASGDNSSNKMAHTKVTAAGHNSSFDNSGDYYYINCVAWARGVNYSSANSNKEWENASYKCTVNGNSTQEKQLRTFTNEFLKCLVQEYAKDARFSGNGNNPYDGFSAQTLPFKFKKDAGHGVPECWMVCVNCSNYKVEIWIGDKNLNGRGSGRIVHPLYRIYPEPCEEYRN